MTELLLPYGHHPACTEAQARRFGYWTATDARGYEYAVGAYATKDETGTLDIDGARRVWDMQNGAWVERPRAVAPESQQRWTADGKGLDADFPGRVDCLRELHVYVDACVRGERASLWLWGEPGRGKDALSRCILRDLTASGAACVSTRWGDLVAGLRGSYMDTGRTRWSELWARVTAAHVLHVADVQPHASDDVRAMLLEIVDVREGAVTIATSNMEPEAFAAMDPRISSRLCGWRRVLLAGRDYRQEVQ